VAGVKRSRRFGALGTHGARMLNFTSILAVGAASATLLAVVRIAVLTRVLEISVYGQLTLLIITAGLVMMLLRMAIVTGTLVTAFRGEEDDDLGAGDSTAEAPPSPEPTMSESKAILGTGLTATLLITVLASSLAYLFGEPLNELLIGSTTSLQIALAVLLGGFDATFHLSSTISRYERLPVRFVLLQLFNAVSGLALATLLALAGLGLTGAILGLASGTLLSTLVALWTNRHRFTLHLSPSYLALLSKRGAPIIGITLGFWIFRHTDLFLVSRYLTESDVALYRAAARIGAIASAFLGAVLLARGPLLQGPLRDTANPNEIASAADARLFTYVLLLGLWLLVAFVLTRDLLIMVAPPEYSAAAPLIPLLGLAALSVTTLTLTYRTSKLKRKKSLMVGVLLAMSATLMLLSVWLIPHLALTGAALASIFPALFASVFYFVVSQRYSDSPLTLHGMRLLAAFVIAVVYVLLILPLGGLLNGYELALNLVAALAFPAGLIVCRVLPLGEVRSLIRLLSLARSTQSDWNHRVSLLGDDDLRLLTKYLRQNTSARNTSAQMGLSEAAFFARLTRVLCRVGQYKMDSMSEEEAGRRLDMLREARGSEIADPHTNLSASVDNSDLASIEAIATQLESMPERRWHAMTGIPVSTKTTTSNHEQ